VSEPQSSEPQSWQLERQGGIALLELHHGKANEMGAEQVAAFDALAQELEGDGTRALLTWSRRVSSRGTPIFIAGANVKERTGWDRERVATHVRNQRRVMARMRNLPLFHLAVVHGVALGWGTEFLITADYRIATPGARFGLPETGLGILPGAGGSAELWSLIGVPQALRLGMTGELISPEEAVRIGLVQEISDDVDTALARGLEIAGRVARNSPTAVAAFKRACLGAVGRSSGDRMELEARAYEHCLDAGDAALGRAHFDAIRKGESVPWGAMQRFEP
jgi:enoyl-CoA hydratase/carnithine racemase